MNKLTAEQIIENNKRFNSLVTSISRQSRIADLFDMLNASDFYDAPASCKYHLNCRGGLVEHSLNVYDNLVTLINSAPNKVIQKISEASVSNNLDETLIIVALFHDISKMNFYEPTIINKKIYNTQGSKSDNLGRFDWIAKEEYKTRDNKFIYGSHEMNSEFIIRQYIPLTISESIAILHHMGGQAYDSAKDDLSEVFKQYPLALYLHLADMMATYVQENEQYN